MGSYSEAGHQVSTTQTTTSSTNTVLKNRVFGVPTLYALQEDYIEPEACRHSETMGAGSLQATHRTIHLEA